MAIGLTLWLRFWGEWWKAHSAHGYMGLQFMSARANKRIDDFGGRVAGELQ